MFFSNSSRCVLALLACTITARAVEAQQTQKKVEELARSLPILATAEVFVYDRGAYVGWPGFQIPPEWGDAHRNCLHELMRAKFPERDLLALLGHKDAKVRTLAIVALFARDDPQCLPHLHRLVKDQADTFAHPERDLRADVRPKFDPVRDPIKTRPQTVGDVATLAIDTYLKAAGFDARPIKGKPDISAFEKYWEQRKARTHCLSWFALRLQRATQGISPVRQDRLALIRSLRQDIDRLPAEDRAWTLLALADELADEARRELASVDDLVKACRQLGTPKLLALLAARKISDDPDLALPQARLHYTTMQRFVLRHAAAVLDKDAGDKLPAIRRANPDALSSPWWHIAAAELAPERGMPILLAGMKEWAGQYRGRDRAELVAAAWRIAGPKQSKFIRDWFYSEAPEPGSEPHTVLLQSVFKHRPKENRIFLAELVQDARFAQTDWHTLRHLITALNDWTKQPILTCEEMRDLHHPLGSYHFVGNRPGERARYPKETAQVLKTLADWRQRVRDSVPEWREHKGDVK
jgi:hypothetical protein